MVARARQLPSTLGDVLTILARIIGLLLRAGIALILLVRRPRPIHARGAVYSGEIRWLPGHRATGIAWVDSPPDSTASITARASRGVGLPSWLPDVFGVALRTEAAGVPADLELSSSGVGVPGRFLLVPRWSPVRATLGTLLPYRGSRGPVLICARTTVPARSSAGAGGSADAPSPWTLRLYTARPTGRWHPFAEVTLNRSAGQDDSALRFDAVRHPLPGAGTYEWTRALRQPSYRLVQD
jgi:hypothetical protein